MTLIYSCSSKVCSALYSTLAKSLGDFKSDLVSLEGSNISYGTLIVYLAVGALLLRMGLGYNCMPSDRPKRGIAGLLGQIFPKNIYLTASMKKDVQLYILYTVFFVPISLFILPLAESSKLETYLGNIALKFLHNGFGASKFQVSNGLFVDIVYTIVSLVAYDFGHYWGHRIQHKNKYLWEFHKVHHSANVLNPLTNLRSHLTGFINGACGALSAGLVDATIFYFFKAPPSYLSIAGFISLDLIIFVMLDFGHSHIWISLGKWEKIFYSPAMHLIHHSVDPIHYDRNYAVLFSIWDRAFGTYFKTDKRPPQNYRPGLEDDFDWNNESFLKVLWHPFEMCYLIFTGRVQAPGKAQDTPKEHDITKKSA